MDSKDELFLEEALANLHLLPEILSELMSIRRLLSLYVMDEIKTENEMRDAKGINAPR